MSTLGPVRAVEIAEEVQSAHVRAHGDGVQPPHRHHLLVHRIRASRGKTGPHADGWGVALYEGKFASSFLEPRPACESAMANFIRDNPIKTLLAVAHVRKKTRGRASLENTHPFKRVLWGRHWVFAHNGTLPHVKKHKLRVEEAARRDRQRARLLLDDRTHPRRLPGRLSQGSAAALAAGGRARRRARRRREVQLSARRRPPPLRALRNQALLHHPQGAVRTRHARATPRWRSISRRSPASGIAWWSSRPSRSRATKFGSRGRRGRSGCSAAAPCARHFPAGPPTAIRPARAALEVAVPPATRAA